PRASSPAHPRANAPGPSRPRGCAPAATAPAPPPPRRSSSPLRLFPRRTGSASLFRVVRRSLDACHLHLARLRLVAPLPLADLAQPRQHVLLEGGEFLLRDLAQFQPHLRRQQLLAQLAVVVQLG